MGPSSHNVLYYALPLGATSLSTQEFLSFFLFFQNFSPPGLLNVAVSVTLARNQTGGRIPSSPTHQPRPGDSGAPASCSPRRAQRGLQPGNGRLERLERLERRAKRRRAEAGGKNKSRGTHFLSFSPHYRDAWCPANACDLYEVRAEIQSAGRGEK